MEETPDEIECDNCLQVFFKPLMCGDCPQLAVGEPKPIDPSAMICTYGYVLV